MSNSNRRSWQPSGVGQFMLTVELDPHADDQRVERHRNLPNVGKHLIELFDAHRLPATWGVSDPAFSAFATLINQSAVRHETAILGDANWVGATAGRTRFARELERRVAKARSVGIAATTLIPRADSVAPHIDLVVKQGITAIVGVDDSPSKSEPISPRALHYAVWELPVSLRLPRQIPSYFAVWWLRRLFRRAAANRQTIHVVVDAPALAGDFKRGARVIAEMARQLDDLRKQRLATIETLSSTSNRLSDVTPPSPQRSILRQVA